MIGRRTLIASGLAAATLRPARARQPSPRLRAMSFNVRLPIASDGDDYWPNRARLFFDTVRAADPDIVGTQELFKLQGDAWIAALPGWAWFGIDRRGGHADEHMGVFYRHDRLRVIDLGNFWLSETPDVLASISWGHPLPRMATWGLFERIADGRRFHLFNTHFPYRAEDEAARTRCAGVIADRIAAIAGPGPVVLTGDFNTGPDSEAHAVLTRDLADARGAAQTVEGPEGTFHGFEGTPGKRIDWLLTRGFAVERFATIDANTDGRYPSDHFPVLADLRFNG
ncbi:endonuclease/exonuclease/phosphatase family protein [Sphingomonas japonica]|uniref:Endonuclease/exonuclease/phosphatase family metal-dependent hydrolase n=2 Tax=Sphingomonas japonica TaxID=511662 RepID=A0ABX0TZF5_9SPHN|nr:endonuclease/exonuclease/phosphatase family protein [Sphingomonas japonica]NIJ23701.1 endonuclease/exonuclease/phosphatase family metal-dependent hydrolase [Sphingomonas japonica]